MVNRPASSVDKLPAIPDKRYFTIGEVSTLCAVKPHVLRYWEQEFPILRPSKRRGNRRYYRREDVMVIRQIKYLLYEQGFTISGARHQIASQKQAVKSEETITPEVAPVLASETIALGHDTEQAPAPKAENDALRQQLVADLEEVLSILL